jgi:hypothetical protein
MPSPDVPSPGAGYAAPTESLRSATRWLLTAAAAAGGALVAGLQLTSIGSLEKANWLRLGIAIAAAVGVFTAVGYMISRTSKLLADEWITLAQLQLERFTRRLRNSPSKRDKQRGEALERIYTEIQDYRDELYGDVAESVADLYAQLQKANEAARRWPLSPRARKSGPLKNAADAVVQYANYSYTRGNFEALRGQLARAAAVTVAGVLIFAYAANPPAPSRSRTAARAGKATTGARPQATPSPTASPGKPAP